jgi:hypothetical protein
MLRVQDLAVHCCQFIEAGGKLLEGIDFKGAEVYADGVALKLGAAGSLSVSDANR